MEKRAFGKTGMAKLKEEGKARHIDGSQMERANAIAPVETLQPPYNMLNRGVEEEILPYCAEREIVERHGRSPAEVAIACTLRHPAVTAAIVGGAAKSEEARSCNFPKDFCGARRRRPTR